ncbi:hypothetical protein BD410DRAFT_589187 [Rickenella mellea]|uniref:Zn(2)-C6 fungal-type domain-containing protein n=1 Tax=Rickenella mellea TaxID=50990 RepID=A0A4Y7PND4_9AGAM|nr:hypothetical protein BD410DRAFT_589187 [Rickenella mellea]
MPVPSTLAGVAKVVKKRIPSCSACREKKMKCNMSPGTTECERCETKGVPCSGPQPTAQAVKKKEQRKQFSNSRASGVVYPTSLGFGAHHAGTGSASAASAPATVPVPKMAEQPAISYAATTPSLSTPMDATYINYSNFAPTASQNVLRNNGGDQFLCTFDTDES